MITDFTNVFLFLALILGVLSSIVPYCFKKFTWIKLTHIILLGFSSTFMLLSGIITLLNSSSSYFSLPINFLNLSWSICLDPLAAFFLIIVGIVVMSVVFYIPNYLRKHEHSSQSLRQLTFFTGLFISGMYLVALAHDVLTFVAAWELMSLTSYFLVIYQHHNSENRQAGFVYLVMAHLSGLLVLLGFGILVKFTNSFDFASFQLNSIPPLWATLAFIFAFLGFGMKAGLVPLHVWLPRAHPVAPSHISALMSGVMLKIAVYGFIRFVFCLLHQISWQEGMLVLAAGSISALLGVLYALTQHNLKRLLAYHSVENIGIIFIGLGLAMIFYSSQQKVIALIGLVAALYHCLNHAVFKSLLFLGAGAISQRTHEHDLEKMGGLIHRMPFTALMFLIGCLSISALPPFNGFVSEWLTFQTSLQATALESGVLRALIPVVAALLALTSALAAACFVKVYGIAFLGLPRSRHAKRASCTKFGMHVSLGILAALCILLGLLPTLTISALSGITTMTLGTAIPREMFAHWLWLTPPAAATTSYGAIPIVVLALSIALVCYIAFKCFRSVKTSAPVKRWDCGFGNLTNRMQYTSTAFAMPIRRVFSSLWQIKEELVDNTYKLTVTDRIWNKCYEPLGRIILLITKHLTKIQGGSTRMYLACMFFTLLFLLWVIS